MSIETIQSKFIRKVPYAIINRIYVSINTYNLCFSDAVREAFRNYHKAGPYTEIYNAWYYDDFRAFCPSMYDLKYLDFEKYPLKYSVYEDVV